MNKPELLCPAGDLERLQMALHFGADAVYLAGAQFGMRAGAENFTPDGIRAAVQLAHAQGAAVHVTCNTLPRDDEMVQLPAYLELLDDAGVDAIIAADLGVITLCQAMRRTSRCTSARSSAWSIRRPRRCMTSARSGRAARAVACRDRRHPRPHAA
ncbi:MAG: peptidase U32 family protein [Oscillospiraceae bacterium]